MDKQPLSYALEKARLWRKSLRPDDKGNHFFPLFETKDKASWGLPYTAEELATVHPDLPNLLDSALPADHNMFTGDNVRETLQLWEHPPLRFPSEFFVSSTTAPSVAIKQYRNISRMPGCEDTIQIGVMLYLDEELPNNSFYIVGAYADIVVVPTTYLDAHCPGWEHRWLVAESVGLSMRELSAFVISGNTPPKGSDMARIDAQKTSGIEMPSEW